MSEGQKLFIALVILLLLMVWSTSGDPCADARHSPDNYQSCQWRLQDEANSRQYP
jgi:hypothetical protein